MGKPMRKHRKEINSLTDEDARLSDCDLFVTLDYSKGFILLEWTEIQTNFPVGEMSVRCTGLDELSWRLEGSIGSPAFKTTHESAAIRSRLNHLRKVFQVAPEDLCIGFRDPSKSSGKSKSDDWSFIDMPDGKSRWRILETLIVQMAEEIRVRFTPLEQILSENDFIDAERELRLKQKRIEKAEKQRAELAQRMWETQHRTPQRGRRQEAPQQPDRNTNAKTPAPTLTAAPQSPRPPLPPVPLSIEVPLLQLQQTKEPLADLRSYFLLERASLWWVSNQSDDLLALPYCNIQRLEYQIRTALRVIGPLRGRALLSDEVGLGKTIESGLVIKEYLTRGMIKRFLVLTVPSLVDQWQEELQEKFHLDTATTNQPSFRADPAAFWQQNTGIVASLHTLKQPAQLAVAQNINWDMLVIDEAHYLRNRTSQAWQAVNALPRQFLLLLSATPVQNSLEELYNLVTLLQPGQLPSPKEFRDRFIDKKRPHQPKEPEELRRLLGQVMIRNTRANAGINIPPRRAETVIFEPEEAERLFWQQWETELRAELSKLSASQSSLWGRLLLQTAGSSPAAWRDTLRSFPNKAAAKAWREQSPLESSWEKKCNLVVPLTQGEGGVVVFTQFIETQATLARHLEMLKLPVWVINGQTPAPQRQPITEEFRRKGGALLLTHSGTEGRNLQFCHRLVNFDLPWNPMEIEQRIGRLHRLGQQHPVHIYNFVQTHSLQEHLLHVLQEKLNLFELVVGETGLILGDRFSSDEFAEEIFRRWRDNEGGVGASIKSLGDELAAAREAYNEVKKLDETLFAQDYESL